MTLNIIEDIKAKIKDRKRIVLPEGQEPRILEAASKLHKENVIDVILLGNVEEIKKVASEKGFDIDGIEIINVEISEKFDEYVDSFVKLRKGKNTKDEAIKMLKNVNYYGTMMVQLGDADGMVSGAIHTTGDTVRPALQIIKTKPGVSRTSGAMVMVGKEGQKSLFADIAINPNLSAQELAEVAVVSADTARIFDIEPRVAMLSFSTNGSAKTEESLKVAEATKIAKELAKEQGVDAEIDGEMQFDAAVSKTVGQLKFPGSKVAGNANTFIFPTLESGNIGYKIAQRLGGLVAVGPILQGLNKPVNDLSRGCVAEDVYLTCLVTAAQAK